jgi:tetratricopeptide (TPR) repeat protein
MIQKTPASRWRELVDSAVSSLRNGQPRQALELLQRAQHQAPGERSVRYWLGNAYRMSGNPGRAGEIFRTLLQENPADFDTSFALAFLLRETGAPGEAAEVLLMAGTQPGVAVQQLLQLAGFLRDSNQFAEAIELTEKAIAQNPDQADLHFKLARLQLATGAFDQALIALRRTLDLDASTGPAWTALAQLKQFESEHDVEFLRIKAAAAQSHGREADTCIAFALGKALDDLKRWPEAWAQYTRGNRMMSEASPWRPEAWSKFVDRAIAMAGAPATRKTASPGLDRNAVFIVGMPRSGTTLLEQMLDRHPCINGRGELNFLSALSVQAATGPLGDQQKRQMEIFLWSQMRLEGPEDGYYIDKNPLNFRHMDLLFNLLPTARVLHVTRDARASCLSCYFQMFQHKDMAFTYRLDHLTQFYAGYKRLMAHWETVYPDRILQLDYDELVRSPEKTLASVLQFLGADWHEAVMQTGDEGRVVRSASAWQARQPLHLRSRERWRNYHEHARDFFDALAQLDSRQTGR